MTIEQERPDVMTALAEAAQEVHGDLPIVTMAALMTPDQYAAKLAATEPMQAIARKVAATDGLIDALREMQREAVVLSDKWRSLGDPTYDPLRHKPSLAMRMAEADAAIAAALRKT